MSIFLYVSSVLYIEYEAVLYLTVSKCLWYITSCWLECRSHDHKVDDNYEYHYRLSFQELSPTKYLEDRSRDFQVLPV